MYSITKPSDVSELLSAQHYTPHNAEMIAQAIARGFVTEFGKQFKNSDPETTQKFLASMITGTTNALTGPELQKLCIDIQKIFDSQGEAQKAANAGIDFTTGNMNRFVNKGLLNNFAKFQGVLISCAIIYWTAQYGIPMAMRMIERQMMKPKLIIASSKKSWYQSMFGAQPKATPMIFSPELHNRLKDIVQVTQTIHKKIKSGKTNSKYRNLMLYGPPGTGKTMFAMELAKLSGLEYVSMSGSSFSKFKDGEGIEALDELFAWANKTNGLLIFIDEAEAFLSMRENMDPQSKGYQILNNFLNYTGTRSNKFMIVFATNHKDSLDSAMHRRIDDLIEIPLPGKTERIQILNLYKDTILMDKEQNEKTFVESAEKILTPTKIEQIADRTNGLSGAELEGIINNIKTNADITEPALITESLIDTVVTQAMNKHAAFLNKSVRA